MRIFKSDPLNTLRLNTIILFQDTSEPSARGLSVSTDANPAAVKIGRVQMAAVWIVEAAPLGTGAGLNARALSMATEMKAVRFLMAILLLPDQF